MALLSQEQKKGSLKAGGAPVAVPNASQSVAKTENNQRQNLGEERMRGKSAAPTEIATGGDGRKQWRGQSKESLYQRKFNRTDLAF